ncbi:hypothetical protein GALL_487760 [mine drainage metagenome]|uniref:Nucleotide-binding protein n=1 Tax=mine drainage metagenome TaxID=410659 RepID=A0A1J5Q171_9ZZZZ
MDVKNLFAMILLSCSSLVWSASPAAASPATSLSGEVLEVKNVPNYTYLRLKTGTGDVWAAVATAPVKSGDKVTVEQAEQMDNFESKTLKQTFAVIYFGSLARPDLNSPDAVAKVASAHAAMPKTALAADVRVAKAAGADAHSVAELYAMAAQLKDKPVLLHVRVVKFSAAIMGKNWAHLRDGTGSDAAGDNDVLATTQEQMKVGDVVLLKGTLRQDKNFGAGYVYKVLIEDARLQK